MGYYIRRGTEAAKGPYPASLLRRLAQSGRIRATDEVMPEGGTRWYRAWRIKDFGLERPAINAVEPRESVVRRADQAIAAASVAMPAAELTPALTPALTPVLAPASSMGCLEALEPPPLVDVSQDDEGVDEPSHLMPEPVPDGVGEVPLTPVLRLVREPDAEEAAERNEPERASHTVAKHPRDGGSIDLVLKQTLSVQGIKAEAEPGERLVGTLAQDPGDSLVCGWGAFLSRTRGSIVATNRRIFICRPRGSGMEFHALDLRVVRRVSLEQRLVWTRAAAVAALAAGAIALGIWAGIARAPDSYTMAVEGAIAFGLAAGLSTVAGLIAGRMRHPSIIVRTAEDGHREAFDLPCQRADRYVVMRVSALVGRTPPEAAAVPEGNPRAEAPSPDSSDVGEVRPFGERVRDRAAC